MYVVHQWPLLRTGCGEPDVLEHISVAAVLADASAVASVFAVASTACEVRGAEEAGDTVARSQLRALHNLFTTRVAVLAPVFAGTGIGQGGVEG